MVTLFNAQRLCAVAVVTLLLCGCRSASVTSSSGVGRVPAGIGGNSYARPYGKAGQPYDEEYRSFQSPSPLPDPTGIAPVPGYSEPEDTPVPPTPSAKKSRWNLVPPGLKPSLSRSQGDVHQTGVDSERGFSKKTPKSGSLNRSAEMNTPRLSEETVGSRSAGRSIRNNVAESESYDSSISETPILPPPPVNQANEDRSSAKTGAASRYAMKGFSPGLPRDFRARPLPSLDPVARPLPVQNEGEASAAAADGEMPLLLPPGN